MRTTDPRFSQLELVSKDDSESIVYKVVFSEEVVFGYLYVEPQSYTLAWSGPHGFKFDGKQPYEFLEHQFSKFAPSAIKRMDLILPKPPPHSKAMAKLLHYYYEVASATLLVADSEHSFKEYDLEDRDGNDDRRQYQWMLDDPEAISRIRFARYDSLVVQDPDSPDRFQCCFTLESPQSAPSDKWEFAFSVPRNLILRRRVLVWIVRNHLATDKLVRRISELDRFRDALAGIL